MEQFLTIKQLMQLLSISRNTVYRWLEVGLPCIQHGKVKRFEKEAVLAWFRGKTRTRGDGVYLRPGIYQCDGCGAAGPMRKPMLADWLRCPKCGSRSARRIGDIEG